MMLTRSRSTSTHPTQAMRYHVFLSFRGPDSRKTFTDHLYAALVRKGIVTFRDDLAIEKGDAISEQLRKAIQQSRYFIIVLSKDFASSPWCLNELQQIVETKPKQTIFPIFYEVQSGHIGYDRGGKLERHKGRYSSQQIKRWREALSKVAKITGWITQNKNNATEQQNMHDRFQNMSVNTEMEECLYKALEEEASKKYLHMHDLLQEMGRNIVFQESPINAGRRSRLWSFEDINLVLKENKGTEHVQSIILETQEGFDADWNPKCFLKMTNLRLLDLSKVHLLKKLKSLPTALKFLRWDHYAEYCLPSIEKLWNLESLQLRNSKIEKLWERNPDLNKLRIIDMSGSESLSETPDFGGTPNLEELLLNRCRKLTKVHVSVKGLKKLVKLSLKECVELVTLPSELEMNNLQELILMGCRRLKKLPDFGEDMSRLYFFNVSNTRITQIPSTIIYLINLKILDLWDCLELRSLPVDLPPALLVCASNSPWLKNTIAQLNLSSSPVSKRPADLQGPIHSFDEFRAGAQILEWFERMEYSWGKNTSGEYVTITTDIPSNVVADSNEECWGTAICLFLKSLSQASQSYIVWSFLDKRDTDKTEMDGNLKPDDDWGVYVGFYPFDKEQYREATQLNFTLSFLTTNTARDVRDLPIMGCRWRLASKLDFDEWRENRHGFNNRDRGESSRNVTRRKGKGQIQEIQETGESSRSVPKRNVKRKNQSTRRNYPLRSGKAPRIR